MKPNHINEQCAAMLGWHSSGHHRSIACWMKNANGCEVTTGYVVTGDHGVFSPATNPAHLQMCIEFAAKDDKLWHRFSCKVWYSCHDAGDCTVTAALLLPTLTLATLLVEAWEETRS